MTFGISNIYHALTHSATVAATVVKEKVAHSTFFHYLPKNPLPQIQFNCLHDSAIRKISGALAVALLCLMPCCQSKEAALELESKVVKIESIQELPLAHPKGTIFFFDIDDTLIDAPYTLGSRAWRKYITQATKNSDKNWHDILTIFLARNFPIVTVETTTKQLLEDLQKRDYAVCGFTSRERKAWYNTSVDGVDVLTIKQLASVGIHLNAFTSMYPDLAKDSEYFEGIFFVNTELKGEYLQKLLKALESSKMPKKIVFVDDKLEHVKSAASVLSEMHIDHECYWYCATERKMNRFNPLIGNIQLHHLLLTKTMLSDEEAMKVAQQYPERDANYYLQAALDYVKVFPETVRN